MIQITYVVYLNASTRAGCLFLEKLLDRGVRVNAIIYEDQKSAMRQSADIIVGETALFCAIKCRQYNVAMLLIDKGANPNISSTGQKPSLPLQLAISYDVKTDLGLIQNLLTNVNFGLAENRFVFKHACARGRLDIVRLMLAAGAAATLGDDPSPLEIAIMRLDRAHLDLDKRRCRRNNPDERAAPSALEDK